MSDVLSLRCLMWSHSVPILLTSDFGTGCWVYKSGVQRGPGLGRNLSEHDHQQGSDI